MVDKSETVGGGEARASVSNKLEVGNDGGKSGSDVDDGSGEDDGDGDGDGESEDDTSTRRSERRLRHSRLAGVRRRMKAHKRRERGMGPQLPDLGQGQTRGYLYATQR